MNRFPEIAILLLLTLGLLTSGTPHREFSYVVNPDFRMDQEPDTSEYNRYIKVDSFNLLILPPSSGIQFYGDSIVFLSTSKNQEKMLPDHISFGTSEAYYALPEDSSLGRQAIFSLSNPFTYPCEAITFSPDYQSMYFTMIPKKDFRTKIFMAKRTIDAKNQSGWRPDLKPMAFCTDNATYTHPSLSADGKILIFASDKSDSFGGMDLFITRKTDEEWSNPKNLGKPINSSGNELFPFLDSDNNLFYSSDGQSGYGGYDIYSCKFNGESWDAPINLSRLINSENDDIAFSINKIYGKTAFYSTRQISDKNNIQLFKVTLKNNIADSNLITISNVFNGKPATTPGLNIEDMVTQVNVPESEPEITESAIAETDKEVKNEKPEVKIQEAILLPELKKEEIKSSPPVTKTPETKTDSGKPAINTTTSSSSSIDKDKVIYRVQFRSDMKPLKEKQVIIDGNSYDVFEYFYKGAYRHTVGKFTSTGPAKALQKILNKSGYPQAFVAAFKNDIRYLDAFK